MKQNLDFHKRSYPVWEKFRFSPIGKALWLGVLFPCYVLWVAGYVLLNRRRLERRRAEFASRDLETLQREGRKIGYVAITIYDWHAIWHRPHHIFWRIAERYPVVYLRPHFFQLLLQSLRPRWRDESEQISPSLLLEDPVLLSGEDWLPIIKEWNKWYLLGKVYKALDKMGCEGFVLWYNFPQSPYLAGEAGEAALVYDILDNYQGFSWASKGLGWREDLLLRKADVVFAGTGQLHKSKQGSTRRSHFLPCGVEFEHFHSATLPETALPDDLPPKQGPVLGYFGTCDDRVDLELLQKMHDRHPDWTIIMVGPLLQPDDFAYRNHPKIRFLGLRSYKELPKYLKYWDVSLIPFVLNEVTRNINPTKLLEYLAAGKPVVTPAIPDVVDHYSGVVGIGHDHDEFIALCEQALAEQDPAATQRRIATAQDKTWEGVVSFVLDEVQVAARDRAAVPSADRSPVRTS